MIALVYDSLFGNTALIARALADEAIALGNELTEMRVDDFDIDVLRKADILLIGSPTQAFSASKLMLELLGQITTDSIQNKKVIVFDTRIDLDSMKSKFLRWLVNRGGYATSPISNILKKKGAKILGCEGFMVADKEGPLLDGEEERAANWIRSILVNQ